MLFCSYDRITHPVKNIKLFFRKIKWCRQRIRKGYSDYDVIDIDVWFYKTVPNMLSDFRKWNTIGYPAGLNSEWYEEHKEELGVSFDEFISVNPNSDLKDDLHRRMGSDCRQKWNSIIDEMIFLFSEANEDTCSKEHDWHTDSFDRTASDEIFKYREECRKKAFALFCDWFECLWLP